MKMPAIQKPKFEVNKEYWVKSTTTVGVCRVTVYGFSPVGEIVHLRADDCFEKEGSGFCCGDVKPFAVGDVTVIEAL